MRPEAEQALLREHVARWKKAGPELERIRLNELRGLDTVEAVKDLMAAIDLATKQPLRPSSGLVEQQAYFKKLHAST